MRKYIDKEGLKEYLNSLNCKDRDKNLAYAILSGAYFQRDRKGKGTRSVHFLNETQRVDTYEGRLRATEKILGKNYDSKELENILFVKKESVPSSENSNPQNRETSESYVGATNNSTPTKKDGLTSRIFNTWSKHCPACKLARRYSPETAKKIGEVSSKVAEFLDKERKISPSLERAIVYGISSLGLAAIIGLGIYEKGNTSLSNIVRIDRVEINQRDSTPAKEAQDQKVPPFFFYTLGQYSGLEKAIETLPKNNYSKIPKKENNEIVLEVKPTKKTGFRLEYLEKNNSPSREPSFSVASDLETYLEHSNFRNSCIIDSGKEKGISLNPGFVFGNIKDNFTPFGINISSVNDLGYSRKNFESREEEALNGFKKVGNGAIKLGTLGFVDLNSEEEQKREGNQILRVLKSPYDIAFGLIDSTTNGMDFITGGLLNKTIETGTNLSYGLTNSIADVVNYGVAIPFSGTKEIEDLTFSNSGKVSQTSYEVISTLPRFATNVINHEVAREGKEILIYEDGKQFRLNKGEIGATLELSSSLALDTLGIIGLATNSGSNGNSINKNVPQNGGIIGGPGTGGNVGGGI